MHFKHFQISFDYQNCCREIEIFQVLFLKSFKVIVLTQNQARFIAENVRHLLYS